MFCSHTTRLAVVIILPLLLSAALRAEDWPQWRGLKRWCVQ